MCAARHLPRPVVRALRNAKSASAASEVPPLLEVRLDHRREDRPLSALFQREGAESRLVACRLTESGPRRLVRWLDVRIAEERVDHFLITLRRRFRYRNLAVARLDRGRVLLRLSEPAPPICIATYRAGGICVSCPLLSYEEEGRWSVILPRGARIPALLHDVPEGARGRVAVARPKLPPSAMALTARQDRALKFAYQQVYFDYPRRASLGDVARALGTGRSSALEILRRATAKLAGTRYGERLRSFGVP